MTQTSEKSNAKCTQSHECIRRAGETHTERRQRLVDGLRLVQHRSLRTRLAHLKQTNKTKNESKAKQKNFLKYVCLAIDVYLFRAGQVDQIELAKAHRLGQRVFLRDDKIDNRMTARGARVHLGGRHL